MMQDKQAFEAVAGQASRRSGRGGLTTLVAGLAVAVVAVSAARPAYAIKQFFDEFKEMYVKADGSAEEKALAEAVETAKCNVCHVGKSKKDRNAYGEALAELLDKNEDKSNVEKIRASLEKVAGMESPDGGTFGDRLKAGKLPGEAPEEK
jgi:hypothetical protein